MSNDAKLGWSERLCIRLGLCWDVPDTFPALLAPAALPSTPPVPPAQSIYSREVRLQELKLELHRTSGVQLQDLSYDHEISLALERGDAVIVEVAAGTEAATIHTISVEDFGTFGSLSAWAAFQCSGRETTFDSMFYRVDVEPIEKAREFLAGGGPQGPIWLSGPLIIRPEPVTEEDDNEGGGPASAPVIVRPWPPRGR